MVFRCHYLGWSLVVVYSELQWLLSPRRDYMRLYQNWYCNQSWCNISGVVFLSSPELSRSITLADVSVGQWTLRCVHWPLLGSMCGFQELLRRCFPINGPLCCPQVYRFHSLCVLSWRSFSPFLYFPIDLKSSIEVSRLEFNDEIWCISVSYLSEHSNASGLTKNWWILMKFEVGFYCKLKWLRSSYQHWVVYVVALAKAGSLTDRAKFAVLLGGFAWSRYRS